MASTDDDAQPTVAIEALPIEATARLSSPPPRSETSSTHTRLRYAPVATLGRGGMGVVDLVRDEVLERRVARKICLDERPDALARFLREARIGSLLDHANIAPIYDAGRDADGHTYLTMKFIEGRPLSDLLKSWMADPAAAAEYPLRRRIAMLSRVLEGMAYAHARGVVHRDLKPANIIVGEFGELFIVDWGLAKRLGEAEEASAEVAAQPADEGVAATMQGAVVGTPGYLAPEQARGELDRIGPPSDVFALGVILYELAAGVRAFPGRDAYVIVTQIAEGHVTPIERHGPVPRAVAAVVRRAMAFEPRDRYPDAGAMLADVEALIEGRAPSAYREPIRERLTRLARRHTGKLVAGVALLLVAAGGLGLLAHSWRERAAAETARAQAEGGRAAADRTRAEAETQRAEAETQRAEEARGRLDAQSKLVALEQDKTEKATRRLRALAPYSVAANRMARYVDFGSLQQVVLPLLVEALEIDPSLIEAHLLVVRAHITMQRPQAAIEQMPRLAMALPQAERARLTGVATQVGMAMLTGQPATLPLDLETAESALLPPVPWKAFIATLLLMTKNEARTLTIVEGLLADPRNESWELHTLRGMALVKLNRLAEARALATEQLQRYPALQPLLQLRAEAAFQLGDARAAVADLHYILERDPICDPAIHMLGRIEYRQARNAVKAGRVVPIELWISSLRHHLEAALLGSPLATKDARDAATALVRALPGREKAPLDALLALDTWVALEERVAVADGSGSGSEVLSRALVRRTELAKLVMWMVGSDGEALRRQLGCSSDPLDKLRAALRHGYVDRSRAVLTEVLGVVPATSHYGREAARALAVLEPPK